MKLPSEVLSGRGMIAFPKYSMGEGARVDMEWHAVQRLGAKGKEQGVNEIGSDKL